MGKIVVLTGAGISAESGLGTFRDADGLWEKYPIEQVATPDAFARNPSLVHRFYNLRRAQAAEAEPNAAHVALARLQEARENVVIVTQNVDGLHERAGARVLHMHGALDGALCAHCDHRWTAPPVMSPTDECPACNTQAVRPDIVWFGEMPYHMAEIDAHLAEAELFVSIGTSGQVYPAAGFVTEARVYGARTLELNLEATAPHAFDEARQGSATQIVPEWVAEVLAT